MKKIIKQDIESNLITITQQLLRESQVPSIREIKLSDSLQQVLGIDSLSRAELFKRIESTYQCTLSDRLFAEAETLNDIVSFIENHDVKLVKNQADEVIALPSDAKKPNLDASSAHTLIDVLLMHAAHSSDQVHIHLYNEDNQEETLTFGALLASSLKVAGALQARGLKQGETVAIMQPTHLGFFYTFMGILLAGGVPVPVYPPFRMHLLDTYAKQEARILSNAEVRFLVTFDRAEKLGGLLKAFIPSLKQVVTVDELLKSSSIAVPFKAQADHHALIQYTSGSTSDPKGVLLTHHNLLANIRAYGQAIQVKPTDVVISWLPLYHDLGLIAMWLGSLYYGVPLVLFTPFAFLNHPERWLWAMHHHRGTISGAPNFAYELCVKKIPQAALEGLNLQSIRILVNGAEKIYAHTLAQFNERFKPYGLNPTALLPVYGLAESTVGLLISSIDELFREDHIDQKAFEVEKKALPSKGSTTLSYVSCGQPIPGHAVKIVDEQDQALPERCVGRLLFKGPSSMQGYFHQPKATEAIMHDGWLDSGDLAYAADGDIFITGRKKDVIIKAGRNIYPAELEALVGTIKGVRQGCVVAFGVNDPTRGTEQLIVVAESREKSLQIKDSISKEIKKQVTVFFDIVVDEVMVVAPHAVLKTSSGKLQRAACKSQYLKHQLGKEHQSISTQQAKLIGRWLKHQALKLVSNTAKFAYTTYIGMVFVATLMPLWMVAFFATPKVTTRVFKGWTRFLLLMSFCKVTVNGRERLTASSRLIYVANHASYMDAVVMLSVLPTNTFFVAKKELFNVPFLRLIAKKLNCIGVDRFDSAKSVQDTEKVANLIKQGHSIMIFPEGTFGYASGLRPFRLGAFKIAVETKTAICPIALKGTRKIMRDEEKLLKPGPITVTIGEPHAANGSDWQDVIQLREVARANIANYCGEMALDYISASKIAPKSLR